MFIKSRLYLQKTSINSIVFSGKFNVKHLLNRIQNFKLYKNHLIRYCNLPYNAQAIEQFYFWIIFGSSLDYL